MKELICPVCGCYMLMLKDEDDGAFCHICERWMEYERTMDVNASIHKDIGKGRPAKAHRSKK